MIPTLPNVYRTKGLDCLMDSIDWHLQKAKECHEWVTRNKFLDSADVDGISRFEKMESIVPFQGQDLESRRSACIVKWNSFVPYTERTLTSMLDVWCGTGNYNYVITNSDNYKVFTLTTALQYNSQAEFVYKQLNIVLPLDFKIVINNSYTSATESIINAGNTTLNLIEQEV